MASKDGGAKTPKNPELRGAGKKESLQEIINNGSKAKKPEETHEQYVQRPKVEAKIEEKRKEEKKEDNKPVVGKFTEAEKKREQERDKNE